jgi:hypothetical protein
MKHPKRVVLAFVLVLAILFEGTAFALDREKDFREIGKMDLKALASRAKVGLEKKYPGENWGKYNFPKFVYISEPVQVAYKIAVKRPELLATFPCYCFCEQMGHKNLSYCFLKKGVVEGKFDDHASGCNICVAQAMMAFLWDEIGATEAEMQKAMKEIYGK